MINLLNPQERAAVIDQINSWENRVRKNESLKRLDIYQKRQLRYIDEQLKKEYSDQTVKDMRVISSINLCRRIVDQKASLYSVAPERVFSRRSGQQLSENELAQLTALYELGEINLAMKKANRYFKLEDQALMQITPRDGKICPRILLPHHVDVIPDPQNPELPWAVIISVYDRSLLYNQTYQTQGTTTNYLPQSESDQINQTIADADDYKAKQGRYIWWTADLNFITDARGNLINELGEPLMIRSQEDLMMLSNPIGKLPFVDIATGKEFEFWVRQGNDTVQFSLDFSVLLSDTAEVNKRQAYSQGIIYSEEPPKDMLVGSNRVLHMKLDPNKEVQPRFEWSTPQPDMQASLELLETYLRLYLSSEGVDPKTISGRLEGQKYSSGIDRLLAMLERWEASQDDIDLFRRVEAQALSLMVAWSNVMQGATIQGGVAPLVPELQQASLPEDLMVNVLYQRPQAVQTQAEQRDDLIKSIEAGLMSRKMALMKLEGLTEEQAEEALREIDRDEMLKADLSDQGEDTEDEDSQE